jgi:hypothetical protein
VGFYNILSKVDRALAAYLISEGAGTTDDTFAAKRAPDVPNPPYTVAFSETGRPKVQYGSEYLVKARIDVFTNCAPDKGEDTETMRLDSDDRAAATFDAFHIEENDQSGHALANAITQAARSSGYNDLADFTVTDVTIGEMEQGSAPKEGQWIDSLNLEILCTPHNVSD